MMTDKHIGIAIIGGGVIGLTLARALAAEGADVAVIDAGAQMPCATNAAAGMLAPSFENGDDKGGLGEALYELGARGLAMWADYAAALEEETGVFVDYRSDGALGVAYREEQADRLTEQAAQVVARGGAAEMISGEQARALEPALSKEIIAALHAPKDVQVDPRRVLAALTASLERHKTPIVRGRVIGLERNGAGHSFVTADGDSFKAEKIVLAAGAVSGLVPMGLVFPVKGEALAVASEGAISRIVRAPGAYLCPKAKGRLVIGATEEIGAHDHQAVSEAAIAGLRSNAVRAVSALEGAGELERWAGLRPGTPDCAPILGMDEKERFLCLGHYRNGILHAPAAAQAMAALILRCEPPWDISPFGIERFRPGQDG